MRPIELPENYMRILITVTIISNRSGLIDYKIYRKRSVNLSHCFSYNKNLSYVQYSGVCDTYHTILVCRHLSQTQKYCSNKASVQDIH